MKYEIIFSPEAVNDLRGLKASSKSEIRDAIETHLRHEPRKVSKSRIKKLRGLSRPQFRLRILDDLRVFYDVTESAVEILAIVSKRESTEWLMERGERE